MDNFLDSDVGRDVGFEVEGFAVFEEGEISSKKGNEVEHSRFWEIMLD